ncbi:MAG: Fe-S cluster assembly protein SufD [Paracoccaceae bacterium]
MASDASRKTAEGLLSALPLPEGEAGWARDVRAEARTRLLEAGAPGRRDEYWRFTDPTRLVKPLAPVESDEAPSAVEDAFPGIDAALAEFVNGRRRPDLSDEPAADGLAVQPLAEALGQDLSVARELFGRLETAGNEKVVRPLAILNTATARDGLVMQATGTVARPVHLRYRDIGAAGASVVRHLIRVEEGAELTLLESGTATNSVIEVDLGPGATFRHLRVQSGERPAGVSHVFARVGEGAKFSSFGLMADGELTRAETVMELAGENAVGHVAGAVLGRSEAHLDNTVFVTHAAPDCESRQVFKNVLTEKAKAVFQGKIFVRPVAQKTDGYQISQAVVLDDGAEFLVKPELEIYADDVQCSHGSTTGALDEDALFYLMARGIPRRTAEGMLVEAFADEAIAEIDDGDLADAMRATVAAWMSSRR